MADNLSNQEINNLAQQSIGKLYGNTLDRFSLLDANGNSRLADIGATVVSKAKDFDYQGALNTARDIGIGLSVLLAAILVVALLKIDRYWNERLAILRKTVTASPEAKKPGEDIFDARWKEVREHIKSTNAAEWRFAVIEADKILDDLLKKAKYPGDTFGERLMLMRPGDLATLDNIWSAHKLRNTIAHNPDYQVSYAEAREAIENYEKAIRELGELG